MIVFHTFSDQNDCLLEYLTVIVLWLLNTKGMGMFVVIVCVCVWKYWVFQRKKAVFQTQNVLNQGQFQVAKTSWKVGLHQMVQPNTRNRTEKMSMIIYLKKRNKTVLSIPFESFSFCCISSPTWSSKSSCIAWSNAHPLRYIYQSLISQKSIYIFLRQQMKKWKRNEKKRKAYWWLYLNLN